MTGTENVLLGTCRHFDFHMLPRCSKVGKCLLANLTVVICRHWKGHKTGYILHKKSNFGGKMNKNISDVFLVPFS